MVQQTRVSSTDPDFSHLKTDGYGPGATVLCEVCGAPATRLFPGHRWFCEQHDSKNVTMGGREEASERSV